MEGQPDPGPESWINSIKTSSECIWSENLTHPNPGPESQIDSLKKWFNLFETNIKQIPFKTREMPKEFYEEEKNNIEIKLIPTKPK